jgi:hypothetical protein
MVDSGDKIENLFPEGIQLGSIKISINIFCNSCRNCFALGIVADSPEAGELASLPRTMSGKPDGELASRNAQKIFFKKRIVNIKNSVKRLSIQN